MDEFELIKKYFQKISNNNYSAKNLNDDIFFDKNKKLAVSIDTYNEGVHFPNFKYPNLVIKKVIRASISDLISKGVKPEYYFISGSGNNNKFSKNKVYITLKSNSEFTEITIEDDGPGYPNDILPKIGEPYLKTFNSNHKSKSGLGLGIFIGKTLLEKNFASIYCSNSQTRSGVEVSIKWKNKELFNI